MSTLLQERAGHGARPCSQTLGARRRARGFTLTELMIALAAGIMVSLAIMGLSREASVVFQDESRVAGAEMQLRSGIDRLRNDVQRAAFMSTGNIWIDPAIASPSSTMADGGGVPGPSATTNVANIQQWCPACYNASHMSLGSLAGVRLFTGGSSDAGPDLALNGLSPDAIEIGGYLSNVEELAIGGVSGLTAIASGDANNLCNGQTVYLNVNSSPSIWRLIGLGQGPMPADAATSPTQYEAALNMAFDPIATASTPAGSTFIVRIQNGSSGSTSNTQYALTCAAKAAGWNNGVPAVYLDPTIPVSLPMGVAGENATINPVQIVRWQIGPAVIADPNAGVGAANGPKYDLTRQYLNAYGVAVGAPEVISEYAVDLKFAFTEDTTSDTTGQYSGATSSTQVVYSFEDSTHNGALAGDPTQIALGTDGPQRIRSVRIRLVTRAPTPDRSAKLSAGSDYVYHYCVDTTAAACDAGGPIFARARTVITEVALPNQARFWYR